MYILFINQKNLPDNKKMNNYCSIERNIQILIEVLKANGIHKVIASPGATDVSIVLSMQHDSWFKMYSEVDERGAAYMACGMAAESGEPVVIVCTGATSSRNYMPALTEAYYRRLPVLAITCSRNNRHIGQLVDQVTDRLHLPSDIAYVSVHAQSIHCLDDEIDVRIKANKAVLGLSYNGGGPCHINLETTYERDFSVKEIKNVPPIRRYLLRNICPDIIAKRIAVFVGAHTVWSSELLTEVDNFCRKYNAIVLADHTSNYTGDFKVLFPLIFDQFGSDCGASQIDLLIHIGYVSNCKVAAKSVWRVNEDGELRNTFGNLHAVFQMTEIEFFTLYNQKESKIEHEILGYKSEYDALFRKIPEIPFSNIYVASKLSNVLPKGCVLHLGIRNSIRSWNYFEVDKSIRCYCNTGGFGIDGGLSSLIGASMCHSDKLYFGVFGDLLFFYNMNSLGNRDIKPNLRIVIINNGLGQEFKNKFTISSTFGEEADKYVAAAGHFGNKSPKLVKHFVEDLGFEYLTANNKESFEINYKHFVDEKIGEKPMIFEIFTDSDDEADALHIFMTLTAKAAFVNKATDFVNNPAMLGVKKVIKRFI